MLTTKFFVSPAKLQKYHRPKIILKGISYKKHNIFMLQDYLQDFGAHLLENTTLIYLFLFYRNC